MTAMIDPSKERILPLVQAAKLLPSARCPHGIHVATLHRWIRRGVRGVRLEKICIGGTTCTSEEALGRFFAALSVATDDVASAGSRSARTQRVIETAGLMAPTSRKGRPASATKRAQETASPSSQPEAVASTLTSR